jgi:restriction endonuclease S subunit
MNIKLKDISKVTLGHTFRSALKDCPDGDLFVLQAKDVTANIMSVKKFTAIKSDTIRSNTLIKNGDVLLTNRGRFEACVYDENDKNLIASSSVFIIRANRDIIEPLYLSIFLNSKIGQNLMKTVTRGSSISSLPKNMLQEVEIHVPDIKTQKTIIDLHSNYYNLSRLYERKSVLNKEITETTINKLITKQ